MNSSLFLPSRRQALAALCALPFAGGALATPNGYREADGAVRIEGSPLLVDTLRRWNRLFTQANPATRLRALGTGSDSAVPLLTHGVTLVAAMDRPIHPLEAAAYAKINGARPLEILVGYGRAQGDGHTACSLAIYVNRANPLDRLTMRQLAGLLGQGAPDGDLGTWSQLGVASAAAHAARVIALPGTSATGGLVQQHILKKLDFAAASEFVDTPEALLARVAADPWAIGVAPSVPPPRGAKRIALASDDGSRTWQGTVQDIRSGAYPLACPLTLALRRRQDEPLDPLAVAYVRLALSPQGQSALARGPGGYLPLTPEQALAQQGKLA
ncbi:phosphate-binding protein [Xylophilus rhododendri]|uniref:Phosphate-binding protein n=1 Tax=Xylophilus rhododendri TaxID=2697032 RepID=A0A857JC65_9BURK|nr:substrate-binding domain-containing protein [Xylophilus rhododendri]QHJ00339.1 phosphate-binding protein [Xylophilus rhododendri]